MSSPCTFATSRRYFWQLAPACSQLVGGLPLVAVVEISQAVTWEASAAGVVSTPGTRAFSWSQLISGMLNCIDGGSAATSAGVSLREAGHLGGLVLGELARVRDGLAAS